MADVPRVGRRHDIKEINDGYAVNFLFPRKLAEPATARAITELNKRKETIEIEREVQADLLLRNLEEIKGKIVHLKAKADDKGHLFSGIRAKDIVDAMRQEHHAEVSEEFIALQKPIKETGEYEIPIEIKTAAGGGVSKKSSFKLVVEKA